VLLKILKYDIVRDVAAGGGVAPSDAEFFADLPDNRSYPFPQRLPALCSDTS
jgi:hypothetical protein